MWSGRIPQIWEQLQAQLAQFKQPIEAIRAAREELRGIAGGSGVTVSVDDGSAVESVATLAPAVIAQILIFLASLYFFVATRHRDAHGDPETLLLAAPALAGRAYLSRRRDAGVPLSAVDHRDQRLGG